MNTNEITEEQVKAWMLARLDESMKITPSGATSFEVKADNFDRGLDRRVRIRIYNDKIGSTRENESLAESMGNFRTIAGDFSPTQKAKENRDHAARLLAEADALEASKP